MDKRNDYSLTPAQMDLWYYDQINRQSRAYNVPMAYIIDGRFEKAALKQAVERTINRQPILKTRFFENEEGEVRQWIDESMQIPVLEEQIYEQEEYFIFCTLKQIGFQSFDLKKGCLARFCIYELSNGKTILYLNIHHIIFDGMSIAILLEQIKNEYIKLVNHTESQEPVPTSYFRDFVELQENIISSDKRAYTYWNAQIQKEAQALSFPRKSVAFGTPYESGCCERTVHKSTLDIFRQKYMVSSFSFFLSLYQLLLFRYDKSVPVITLSPFMNRMDKKFVNEVGYFINMISLAGDIREETFIQFVNRTQERIYEMLEYGHYPIQPVKREKKIKNLANSIFYYQNWISPMAAKNEEGNDLKLVYIPSICQEGEFEYVFEILELSEDYTIKIRFDKKIFEEADMNQFITDYLSVMEQVLADSDRFISALEVKGIRQNHAFAYDKDSRVYDYISEQARSHPDKTAIRCGMDSLTYLEVEARSEQFCTCLLSSGIQSGDMIGVCMARSVDLIVTLLAVMKADAVYVPIDVVYPKDRIAYMIQNSDMQLILSDHETSGRLGYISDSIPFLCIEEMKQMQADSGRTERARNNDLVYLLYTSGSTGAPKGVQIYHRGLVNALLSFGHHEPGFHHNDTMFAITTVCFDIAELEMFLPLMQGGTVIFPPQAVLDDLKKVKNEIEQSDANVMQATPATLKALLSIGWVNKDLKILCGGEAMPEDMAEALLQKGVELWNMYGPTETTIWSTVGEVKDISHITIGKPIANTQVYILDEDKKPVPLGEVGELYLSGDSVAKGYLGNAELTAARFLYNPFSEAPYKMYATGDLARFCEDGEIIYCGRKDTQVKIRGYRIELKEIETHLKRLEGIEDAIVVVREESKGKKMLTAFVIPGQMIPDMDGINQQLMKWLPHYMIPVKYIMLKDFPKTLNQKYDRKELSTGSIQNILLHFQYQASETAREETSDILSLVIREIVSYMQTQCDEEMEINIHANIGEYGFDSITFVKFSDFLNGRYRIEVNPTFFYSYISVAAIAGYLLKEHADQIYGVYRIPYARTEENIGQSEDTNDLKMQEALPEEECIAIVGMAGRFPQSDDLEEFWDGLAAGRNMVDLIPAERWNWQTVPDDQMAENIPFNPKWGGFIRDAKMFDAEFFGISPREARCMDPQQRLMLQCAWSAIEDAGHKPGSLYGSDMGVFIGTTGSDYMGMMDKNKIDGYTLTGIAKSVISNRISFVFDWHGPSESIDTACSSSLVAIHRAMWAIRNGECSQAIAGGVNLIFSPFASIASVKVGMLSPDGACKTFDESANGYVRGEGVGCIYLKKLSEAVKDKDTIYAIIRNTAMNHGGRANSLTAPNPGAQAAVIRAAYQNINIQDISYIETHGTGTELGDPIEINGLKEAFWSMNQEKRKETDEPVICRLGSVKTNTGHLEAAAGIASVIKVVLSMKHSYIPGNIHLHNPNPYIDLEGTPFELVREGRKWKPCRKDGEKLLKIAGISSFGFGGVNAHVVLEEYPETIPLKKSSQVPCLIPVSAKTKECLLEYEKKLLAFIRRNPETNMADVAFTMCEGRDIFGFYNIFEATDRQELEQALEHAIDTQSCLTMRKQEKLEVKSSDGNRIPLPTYPFSKTEYWYEDAAVQETTDRRGYPLIDVHSPFVADHIVGTAPIVPAALQLETIRKQAGEAVSCLYDILFYETITEEMTGEIRADKEATASDLLFYLKSAETGKIYSQAAVGSVQQDMKLQQWKQNDLAGFYIGADCYAIFAANGFFYKEAFKVIEQAWYEGNKVLAHIKLPACFDPHFRSGELHPSLLDGALQTVLLLLHGEADHQKEAEMFYPFSIGRLEMLAPLEKECMVHAEEIAQKNPSIRHYNILITNKDGKELLQIRKYLIKKVGQNKTIQNKVLYFGEKKLISEAIDYTSGTEEETLKIFNGKAECLKSVAEAEKEMTIAYANKTHHFVYQYSDELAEEENLRSLFRFLKGMALCCKNTVTYCIVLCISDEGHRKDAFAAACQSLLASLSIEMPAVCTAVIETDQARKGIEFVKYELRKGLPDKRVQYINNRRICYGIQELQRARLDAEQMFEYGDIVLIAGAGKLAEKLADYLIRKYQATIILCGRSRESNYEGMDGQAVSYYSYDLRRRPNAEDLVKQIVHTYGRLDGIVDCAGIIRDDFLIRKAEEVFMDVATAKMEVVRNLDWAARDCVLKYFICYSSVTAIFGNIGQTDYAFGNGYLNGFCKQRNRLVKDGLRKGKSIAVDWCFWQDGGMQPGEQVIANMEDQWGVKPITDDVGMDMLENVVKMTEPFVLPVTGDSSQIRQMFVITDVTLQNQGEQEGKSMKEEKRYIREDMLRNTREYLQKLISSVTGVLAGKITYDKSFNDYGIDSVIIMDLNRALGESFSHLPKTLFFEYDTINELAEFFVTGYEETVKKMFGLSDDQDALKAIQDPAERVEKPSDYAKVWEQERRTAGTVTVGNKDIAIIGVSGLYPMADDIDGFWEHLCQGRDFVIEIPKERWDYRLYFDPDKGTQGKTYSKWGSFLKDIDKFDPLFFGISPMEAQMLDPQERLFMQTVWHTMEDAGYTREHLNHKIVGVFVGVMWGQYQLYGASPLEDGTVLVPASSYASIANRVSYFFNFRGPSLAVDTMCSSSLTSIHLACNSILSGESELAIAGGVNLTVHPNKHIFLSQTKFAASDGRCHSFGEGGDGYVPGEAVGSILLKPAGQAMKDGDNIYAVIKGSSINHGGRSNGYTVPNVKQQAEVISRTYEKTGIHPRTVNYIEAHGTGTALGDPIEIASISNVFGKETDDKQYCSIGSVKSNAGHCESAAGIIGVIKILLQMKYKMLVPSIHSEVLNPNINFETTPFYVQRKLERWERVKLKENDEWVEYPRRAAINSFGAGGSNAHIILEEYEAQQSLSEECEELIVLSGKDKERMRGNIGKLSDYLKKHTEGSRKTISSEVSVYVQDIMLQAISQMTGIPVQDIEQEAFISEYLITTTELQTLVGNINDAAVFLPKPGMNDIVAYPVIKDFMAAMTTRFAPPSYEKEENEQVLFPELTLSNISYTLQVGREAMKERIAVLAKNIPQLIEKLDAYMMGVQSENVFDGSITGNHALLSDVLSEEEEFVDMLMRKNKTNKLAMLWVAGVAIPWNALHHESKKRISLPGYDFRKDLCWLPDILTKPARTDELPAMPAKQMLFVPEWIEMARDVTETEIGESRAVLYYGNVLDGYLDHWLARYQTADQTVFIDLDQHSSIEPDLLKEVVTIYYLSFNNNSFSGLENRTDFEVILKRTVGKLFHAIQEIKEVLKNWKNKKFVILTDDFLQIRADGRSQAIAGGIHGFMRAFAKEYWDIITIFAGLEISDLMKPNFWATAASLKGEAGNLTTYLLGGNQTRELQFTPYPMPIVKQSSFSMNGSYIIIGGSGNVGKKLCRYLGETYRANIIVTGRRAFDQELDSLSKTISAAGGSFTYMQTDIADSAAVSEMLMSVIEKFGAINGIFNLAMSLQYSSINHMTEEMFYHDITAKVTGSVALGKAIVEKQISIDFLCVFSSGDAFTGSSGWSTYALGCAFEDCYGQYLRKVFKLPVVTINWGYWDKEGDEYIDQLKQKGIHPLNETNGMLLLEAVMASRKPQMLALDVKRDILIRMGIVKGSEIKGRDIKDNHKEAGLKATGVEHNLKETEYVRIKQETKTSPLRLEEVKEFVRGVFEKALSIDRDRIEDDIDFTEYGVDSINMADIHKEFEKVTGKLIVTMIAEYSTVAKLANFLWDGYAGQLSAALHSNTEGEKETVILSDTHKDYSNIRLLDEIESRGIVSYLNEYASIYKSGVLKQKAVDARSCTDMTDSKDKMFHMLVKTRFGNELEVFMVGQGKPLLLIPAIGLTIPTWINQFSTYKDEYKLIVIHNPGYGISTLSDKIDGDTVIASFKDVLQQLGIEKVHLVGSCFGGIAAQQFAAAYPEMTASLTLCGAFYKNFGLPDISLESIPIDKMGEVAQIVAGGINKDFDTIIENKQGSTRLFEKARTLLMDSQCVSPLVVMRYISQILTVHTTDILPNIQAHTMCIAGSLDTIVDLDASRYIAEHVQNGVYYEIEGAGHYPYLTHPDQFDLLLKKFLNKQA